MPKLGAGKGQSSPQKSDWVESIAQQRQASDNIRDVLVKTLPTGAISPAEDNPRRLAITAEEIMEYVKAHPFEPGRLQGEGSDYLESYVESVEIHSGLAGKALGDMISVIEFAANIRSAEGLIQPVVVWREGPKTQFQLIVGERRWLAHHVLQESHIAARIFPERPAQIVIDQIQWHENESRERMNLWDRLCRVEKIINGVSSLKTVSKNTVAPLIGKSPAESARYLAVLRSKSKLLKKALQEGRVNNLTQAAKLAGKTDKEIWAFLERAPKAAPSHSIRFDKRADIAPIRQLIVASAEALGYQHLLPEGSLSSHDDLAQAIETLAKAVSETTNETTDS